MSSTFEALETEALQLSTTERGRLIERLIASLDVDPGVEDAWAAEVERCNAQIESGAVSLIHGPEALAKLKAEFRRTTGCTPRRKTISGRQPSTTERRQALLSRSRCCGSSNTPSASCSIVRVSARFGVMANVVS